MYVPRMRLTAGLAWWLRGAHDDGAAELVLRSAVNDRGILITRGHSAEITVSERVHVCALLAAHEARPLEIPSPEDRMRDYVIAITWRNRTSLLPFRGPWAAQGYATRELAIWRTEQLVLDCVRRDLRPPILRVVARWNDGSQARRSAR